MREFNVLLACEIAEIFRQTFLNMCQNKHVGRSLDDFSHVFAHVFDFMISMFFLVLSVFLSTSSDDLTSVPSPRSHGSTDRRANQRVFSPEKKRKPI